MKLTEIENSHPFNYVYSPQNPGDIEAIKAAYNVVANQYGSALPMPDVFVVNHEHMQRAAGMSQHSTVLTGDVFGWFSQKYNAVYISDRLKPARNKVHAAVLVHEFVHYMQFHAESKVGIDDLEKEADWYMNRYIRGDL